MQLVAKILISNFAQQKSDFSLTALIQNFIQETEVTCPEIELSELMCTFSC